MKLVINGVERHCEAATLADIWRMETAGLETQGPRGFAIALNGNVVRRTEWERVRVRDGDAIEIIRAMAGG